MPLSESADAWVSGGPSALVMREYLAPVEGADMPFFPPTFAGTSKGDESSYCIDLLKDGTRVCLIDTVGSQANRMEPLFMEEPYNRLVPQFTITTGDGQSRNLCEFGHRAGDAFLRHSDIYGRFSSALEAKKGGNDEPLAKVAPTSLVFGVWDSRETQVKAPRIVSSVIRAYDIEELTRSAQYFPPVNYRTDELLGETNNTAHNKRRSEEGFNENPSTNKPGGILARGGIRRDVVVNLAALRKLSGRGQDAVLRKYILGLALVSATCATDMDLRQGCNLTRDPAKGDPTWEAVYPDGKREKVELDCKQAMAFAEESAAAFGVGEGGSGRFDPEMAKATLKSKRN